MAIIVSAGARPMLPVGRGAAAGQGGAPVDFAAILDGQQLRGVESEPGEMAPDLDAGIDRCPAGWVLADPALSPRNGEWALQIEFACGEPAFEGVPSDEHGEREVGLLDDSNDDEERVVWTAGMMPDDRPAAWTSATHSDAGPRFDSAPAAAAHVPVQSPAEGALPFEAHRALDHRGHLNAHERVPEPGNQFEPAPAAASAAPVHGDHVQGSRPVQYAPCPGDPAPDVAAVAFAAGRFAAGASQAASPDRGRTATAISPPPPPSRSPSEAASKLAQALERVGVEAPPATTAGPVSAAQAGPAARGQGLGSHTRDAEPHAAPSSARMAPVFAVPLAPERHTAAAQPAGPLMPAPAPQLVMVDPAMQQLVQAMRVQVRDGIGDAVVRLKPEHLGEVSISLRVEQQSVTATVHAEVAAVRHWLQSNEASLRESLAGHGLHLDELVVTGDDRRQDEPEQPEQTRRQRARSRQHRGDSTETFEVIV